MVTLVTESPKNRINTGVFGVTNRIIKLVTGGIKVLEVILFAILGATTKANLWYWICFGFFAFYKIVLFLGNFIKALDKK